MIQLTCNTKYLKHAFAILLLALLSSGSLLGQTTHNINSSSLTITASSPSNYLVTGDGTITANRIIIESNYVGTITLKNVKIKAAANYAAIRVKGSNTANNLLPMTRVNIILDGNNQLESGAGNNASDLIHAGVVTQSNAAALQVDRGAQIHISSIDPNDNTKGVLVARSYHNSDGAAGIGGPNGSVSIGDSGPQGTTQRGDVASGSMNASGGNIIISSGTVSARGGRCGAGIGGGYTTLYCGHIVIFGGDVIAYGGNHSAGIGTGCPAGSGNNGWFSKTSSIIALPPARISATTEQVWGCPPGGCKGLAGANDITYVGDDQSPLVTVKTENAEKNADIYADLTETTSVSSIFNAIVPTGLYDLTKGWFGNTGASGELLFKATFKQKITFFTDAFCTLFDKYGRPFRPKSVPSILSNATVVLPILDIGIALESTASTPLEEGYSATSALASSYMLKISYTDASPMTSVVFDLQNGAATHFSNLKFYAANGTTEISAPTTLSNGTVFFVKVPIKHAKDRGIYNDVLRFTGTWKGENIGYIRQVVTQRVVYDDSNTNTYIKVTASEKTFAVPHPTTKSITLTLNINHSGLTETYNANDVTAKYLVTNEPNYDLALAANPLSGWANLNKPAGDGQNATTTVSFSGKAPGTYYIHWYVISGVVYAHSLTVADPPRDNGGFGPYAIKRAKINLSIKDGKTTIDEGGGTATGTAKLLAKLENGEVAPAGGITINLSYTGTATRGAGNDYTAPNSITIQAGANEATADVVALADYVLEDNGLDGNETVAIASTTATITAGGFTYDILGSPSLGIVDKTDGTISAVLEQNAAEPSTKGKVTFKFPGSGATAVTCTRNVEVEYSYSGASATGNYTPNSPAKATITAGQNSKTIDLSPINNYMVEGNREVIVKIESVTAQ